MLTIDAREGDAEAVSPRICQATRRIRLVSYDEVHIFAWRQGAILQRDYYSARTFRVLLKEPVV